MWVKRVDETAAKVDSNQLSPGKISKNDQNSIDTNSDKLKKENPDCINLMSDKSEKLDSFSVDETAVKADSNKLSQVNISENNPNIIDINSDKFKEENAGFKRGLRVEKFLESIFAGGKILFRVKWKDCDESDLIPMEEIPDKVFEDMAKITYAKDHPAPDAVAKIPEQTEESVLTAAETAEFISQADEIPVISGDMKKNSKQKDELCNTISDFVDIKSKDFKKNNPGFERGLKPEKILRVLKEGGNVLYYVKWENCDDLDFVLADEMNKEAPLIVIEFYNDRLTYHHDEDE